MNTKRGGASIAPLSLPSVGQVSRAHCGQLKEQLPVKNREQLQQVEEIQFEVEEIQFETEM